MKGHNFGTIRYVFTHAELNPGSLCNVSDFCLACMQADETLRRCRGCKRSFGRDRIMLSIDAASEPGDRLLGNVTPAHAGFYHPRCVFKCYFCNVTQIRAIPYEMGGNSSPDIVAIQHTLFSHLPRPGKHELYACSFCESCAERCSCCGGVILDELDRGSGIHSTCRPGTPNRMVADQTMPRPQELLEFDYLLRLDYERLRTLPAQ